MSGGRGPALRRAPSDPTAKKSTNKESQNHERTSGVDRAKGLGQGKTFDFLGFTHVCGRRLSDGKFALDRRTIASRVRKQLKKLKADMKRCRDRPVKEQAAWLRSVLMGCYRYYAVPGNLPMLKQFHTEVVRLW